MAVLEAVDVEVRWRRDGPKTVRAEWRLREELSVDQYGAEALERLNNRVNDQILMVLTETTRNLSGGEKADTPPVMRINIADLEIAPLAPPGD